MFYIKCSQQKFDHVEKLKGKDFTAIDNSIN